MKMTNALRLTCILALSLLVVDCSRLPERDTDIHRREAVVVISGGTAKTVQTATSSKPATKSSVLTIGGSSNVKPFPAVAGSTSGNWKQAAQIALKYLSKIPQLSKATALLNTIFSGDLMLQDVTILLPMRPDSLLQAYRSYSADRQQQLATYHILALRYNYADLRNLAKGEELFTLEGSSVIKKGPAGGYVVQLSDNTTVTPAVVVVPNLYNNTNFIVHGITRLLVPQDMQ